VTVDTLHVLAVSAWLGTLLLVMAAGLPAIVREGVEADRSASVARMVSTFSPRALVAAGLVVLTGAGSALIQLGGIGPLFTTTYGRTLLVKVGIVTVVVAAGLNNWKRTKPGLERGADAGTLRAPATIELLGAALVLLVTAILVALPPH
jgi:putative copper export protein